MLIAACDGSALVNPGPWGWAYAVTRDGTVDTLIKSDAAGYVTEGTNNMGELTAFIELLKATEDQRDEHLHVKADSQYLINSCTKWMDGWKKRGWRKADKKPVLNLELFKEIDRLMQGRNVTFEWVKAHQTRGRGDKLNELVDDLARTAAMQARGTMS